MAHSIQWIVKRVASSGERQKDYLTLAQVVHMILYQGIRVICSISNMRLFFFFCSFTEIIAMDATMSHSGHTKTRMLYNLGTLIYMTLNIPGLYFFFFFLCIFDIVCPTIPSGFHSALLFKSQEDKFPLQFRKGRLATFQHLKSLLSPSVREKKVKPAWSL